MNITSGVAQDFRQALRRLIATPVFTIFAVLSLAVGVAVTTAGYSVINVLFFMDYGVAAPERVAFVVTPYDGWFMRGTVSIPDFHDLRQAQTSFSRLSASTGFQTSATLASTTEVVSAEAVDGEYFSTLGVVAAAGRTIEPSDDQQGAAVVVISDALWRGRFASDPAIVGRTIRLAGRPYEVIGVTGPAFGGANGRIPGTRLWVPLSTHISARAAGQDEATSPRDRRELVVMGHLADAVTEATASAELATLGRNLDVAFPQKGGRNGQASERPWRTRTVAAMQAQDDTGRRVGYTLVVLVSLVLVVACTNLANLVLARGTSRRQELAVRCALGAARWRLVREQCVESLLLASAGAIAAFVVFQILRALLDVEFNLALPFGGSFTLAIRPMLDVTALTLAAVSLLLALLVFGLEPAIQLTRSLDVRGVLAEGAAAVTTARAGRQRTLLRWQVAVSASFFIVATMFVRYTVAEARHESGVEMDGLAVAVLNVRTPEWDEQRTRRVIDRVIDDTRNVPSITSVAASTGLPFGLPSMTRFALQVPGGPAGELQTHVASGIAATPSIFQTLGVPILRGRGFDERDQAGAPPVVILSEFTARRVFGNADAVGRQLNVNQQGYRGRTATVIGVARDTDVGRLFAEPRPFVYLPFTQHFDPYLTIGVRAGDTDGALRTLREALRRADPDLPVDISGPADDVLSGFYMFLRAAGKGALALGGLTLILAMVGLFGIQTHIVGGRTREIGLRMSFGATAGQIQRMVLKDGYRPVVEGLVLGLAGGLAGRVIVRAYLDMENVSIIDPWMIFVVPVPLIVAAFCACYLPARRAAAVEPTVALRHI
jgi:putative ABC transport system permease protein